MAHVHFRRRALDDVARYEAWRRSESHQWRPVDQELIDAIERIVSRFDSFERVPARLLGVKASAPRSSASW